MGNIEAYYWGPVFLINIAVIVVIGFIVRYWSPVGKWNKKRKHIRWARKQCALNEVNIETLAMAYQMQVAGRALRVTTIDKDIRHYTAWIAQERKLLDDRQLDRLIPVQDKLLYILRYATTRRYTGLSPAEFRDVVEGRRRQPLV